MKKRKTTPEKRDAALARITATPDYAALAGCDLVIEAVFEDPAVKAEATRNAEAHLGAEAIFATNTSTLPVAGLATASRDAASFLGIHFFSPVEKMALVEIIRGPETADRAVAKALDFVRQIRKTPIVVNDARFFYANRCVIPYINEGVRMVAEGVEPALDRERRQAARLPPRPAAARRRDLDRPRRQDRQGDEGRARRRLPREPRRRRPLRPRRRGPPRPQGEGRLLRL